MDNNCRIFFNNSDLILASVIWQHLRMIHELIIFTLIALVLCCLARVVSAKGSGVLQRVLDLEAEVRVIVRTVRLSNFMADNHALPFVLRLLLAFRNFLREHDLRGLVTWIWAKQHRGDAITNFALRCCLARLALIHYTLGIVCSKAKLLQQEMVSKGALQLLCKVVRDCSFLVALAEVKFWHQALLACDWVASWDILNFLIEFFNDNINGVTQLD